MKKFIAFAMIRLVLCVACADLIAVEVNLNGLPGGEHYILNVHDKKGSYSCAVQE